MAAIFGVNVKEDPRSIISAEEISRSAGKNNAHYEDSQYEEPTELELMTGTTPMLKKNKDSSVNMSLKELNTLVERLVLSHQRQLSADISLDISNFVNGTLVHTIQDAEEMFYEEATTKIKASLREMKADLQARIEQLNTARDITVSVVKNKKKTTTHLGLVHKSFETLLKATSATTSNGRLNVWLAGPAGSGKTTAATMVAKALNLEFYFNGAIDTEYKLMGYTDAQGRIVSRPFREAYQNGGVYLFDEIDASLPGALLAFNAATANGYCDFPDGSITRHPDCVIIAGANTHGQGASGHYLGRNRQDGAFLDRFVYIDWETDEDLEMNTAPNSEWTAYVQQVRKVVKNLGVQALITPRASYYGSALLEAGLDTDTVIKMTLRKGITEEVWAQITKSLAPIKNNFGNTKPVNLTGGPQW